MYFYIFESFLSKDFCMFGTAFHNDGVIAISHRCYHSWCHRTIKKPPYQWRVYGGEAIICGNERLLDPFYFK